MKMILIASTVLFASVLVNAGEIKRIEGPFSQAGRVEFEFEPITSLKGHCLEGSGQGAMKTGVASIPEYAFAKFNCTVQLVSDADLKKFILDPRQTVVSLTSTASGQ